MRMNQYSASKSFTSAAVGMAMEEGLLELDDKVIDYFPESVPEKVSSELESLMDNLESYCQKKMLL
ncbi:serine hydrolase [Clostridium guangxiense]|nr:hypothetical protein AGR56_00300 [Clostridium sp. DMHC 10]MCD2347992.1 serine hydrolase [Clostridium guangxiense]